jgi:hypothetical protein
MIQELKPVFTSKEDREGASIYPSTDEEDEGVSPRPAIGRETGNLEQDPVKPPPLPPRPASEQQQDESASIQESVSTQAAPAIQNREDLMDRLVDIICGQPESGAHRFRILTIQVAAELLVEFVYTKGGAGKETAAAQAAQQAAAESQLGEVRLYRLALAEVQTRHRVQKGIRALEKKTRNSMGSAAGQAGTLNQPLGMLTGRVERSLTESKRKGGLSLLVRLESIVWCMCLTLLVHARFPMVISGNGQAGCECHCRVVSNLWTRQGFGERA